MKPFKSLISLLMLMTIGCSTLPRPIKPIKITRESKKVEEIYVLSHGWHTGIVVPANDLNKCIPALSKRFSNQTYYELGWGDSGFYQAEKITVFLALHAMFASSGTVLHVVGFKEDPRLYFKSSIIRHVTVTRNGYQNLLEFLKSSFATDHEGNIIAQKHGIYGDSQFYTGMGKYYIFNTCNKWTAKSLESAEMEINPTFKLTASSVINFLDSKQHKKEEDLMPAANP